MRISSEEINFINKIINKTDKKAQLEDNLTTYKKYLILTESYDEEDLEFLDNAIKMSDKIIEIRDTFGSFDIKGLMKTEKKEIIKKKEKKVEKPIVIEKHYNHYINESSSGCGGSVASYRSC